jgi:hypothetical protein
MTLKRAAVIAVVVVAIIYVLPKYANWAARDIGR